MLTRRPQVPPASYNEPPSFWLPRGSQVGSITLTNSRPDKRSLYPIPNRFAISVGPLRRAASNFRPWLALAHE